MKKKDVMIILFSTAIMVLVWIFFSIYQKSVTSTITEEVVTQIIPINPNFDLKTVEKIKKRKKIEPIMESEPQTTEAAKVIPTLTPVTTNLATPSSAQGEILR